MGLIFNSKKPTSEEMLSAAEAQAKADEDEFKALQAQQKADAAAFKKRSQTMQGGGRQGLMFGGNAQGVM